MTERFIQLKKNAEKRCIFFAALFGVSAALFVLGGLLLLFKLLGISFPWYGYTLICIGVGGLVAGLIRLFSYPHTKRFAKSLDERYNLGERVRTMVEYDGQEKVVLDLQRADTEAHLSALPKQKYSVWQGMALCFAPVFAVGILITSLLIPSKKAPTTPIEPPRQEELAKPSEYAVDDLKKIIENVQASQLSSGLKTVNIAVLENLLLDLQADSIVEKATVSEGMLTILTATIAENSYNAIVTAGKEQAPLKLFNKALKESAAAYDGIPEANVYDYTTLQDKRGALESRVTEKLKGYADGVGAEISALTNVEGYIQFANGYLTAIEGVFAQESVQALADDDGIKAAMLALQAGLLQTLNAERNALAEGLQIAGAKGAAKEQFQLFITNGAQSAGVAVAMGSQAYTYMMKEYVLKGVSKIFGVAVPQLEDSEEEKDPPVEGGGGGEGAFHYPSEGLVLDPTDGQYKPYGEVLSSYYARVLALLEEDESQAAAELKGYISAYFDALH